jgi:hypothetical protein
MRFEVGKKYISGNDLIHTFIAYSPLKGYPIWENSNGGVWTDVGCDVKLWKEYKEPVIHTRYIHWFKNPSGGIFSTYNSFAEPPSGYGECLQTDKITYTEKE